MTLWFLNYFFLQLLYISSLCLMEYKVINKPIELDFLSLYYWGYSFVTIQIMSSRCYACLNYEFVKIVLKNRQQRIVSLSLPTVYLFNKSHCNNIQVFKLKPEINFTLMVNSVYITMCSLDGQIFILFFKKRIRLQYC